MTDRATLLGLLDRYGEALGAHDAARLPLAPTVRYTENGQALPLTEGLWATTSAAPKTHLAFADPVAGQAGVFGALEENGAPVLIAARLKAEAGQVSEIETIAVRQGHLLFNPEALAQPSPIVRPVPVGRRASREALVAAANAYFTGIERNDGRMIPVRDDCVRLENGVATVRTEGRSSFGEGRRFNLFSLGAAEQIDIGFFAYISAITDRRFLVIDEELSLVFGVVLFQHPGTMRQVEVKGHGLVDLPPFAQRPSVAMIAEAFQVEDGQIRAIEAVFDFFPYGMGSGWVTR